MTQQRLYGLWESPISSSMMAGEKRLLDVNFSSSADTLLWIEGRGKHSTLVARRGTDAPRDISGAHNVKGGVGYGGGEFDTHQDFVVFCARDGRLYRTGLNKGVPRPITPAFGKAASPKISPDGKWVAYVWTDSETDLLAIVDAQGRQWPQKIVVGADFYMQPTWNHNGTRLAWIAWDHPNMPWDQTRLETARIQAADKRGVKLGPIEVWTSDPDVSVQQPEFSPDGTYLAYVSDASGFGHIYTRNLETNDIVKLTQGDVDFGRPAWVQGVRHFAWSPDGTELVAVRNDRGRMALVSIPVDGSAQQYEAVANYESVSQPIVSTTGTVAFIGSSPKIPPRVVSLDQAAVPRVEARAADERVPPACLAPMRPVHWTYESSAGEVEIYGNYYAPTNPDFESQGLPPAIVMVHGGPTGQRTAAFEARNQFFASRGIAILDVNYRGSTGYGRDYQDSLRTNWGLFDVEDCVAGAKFMTDQDLANPDQLMIMGGSAGGYTVLQALADHSGVFKAGICLYGVGNLFSLAMGTHKFESRYNDSLLGPLPEASQTFRDRSPLFKADQIKDALAIYHGAEDRVVPIDQAESIAGSLRSRGIPHVYHRYDDEGHGFRKPENVEHFFDSLMEFIKENVIFGA